MSEPIHFATQYNDKGAACALVWSPEIQKAIEARISERKLREHRLKRPMASYVEWAKQRGIWSDNPNGD